jgi:hypothetical protein
VNRHVVAVGQLVIEAKRSRSDQAHGRATKASRRYSTGLFEHGRGKRALADFDVQEGRAPCH